MATTRRAFSQGNAVINTGVNGTLIIGSTNQTSKIRHGTMTMKLNTLDVTLIDPTVVPALGDSVLMINPSWSGTVVSKTTSDLVTKKNGHVYVQLSATNSVAAIARVAPFNLSDVPNGTTTIGYRDLSVKTTNNTDGTTTTSGSCVVFTTGLWPAMTFTLTNSNQGYSAQSFSVTNTTVTWFDQNTPIYNIEFGDPIVTMSVWVNSLAQDVSDSEFPIDSTKITDGAVTTPKLAANAVTAAKIQAGTITTTELAAGAITLYDEFTSTALTPAGFSGGWLDFVNTGIYNGLLRQGTVGTIADGRTSALPYFTVSRTGSPVLTYATTSTYSGGHRVRATFAATTNLITMETDKVPVIAGHSYKAICIGTGAGAASTGWTLTVAVKWFDDTGSNVSTDSQDLVVGVGVSAQTFGHNTHWYTLESAPNAVTAPVNARQASVAVSMKETGVHSGSSLIDVGQVGLTATPLAFDPLVDYEIGQLHATSSITTDVGLFAAGLDVSNDAAIGGILSAGNIAWGVVSITPSAPNTPTSASVSFSISGSTFVGFSNATTTVPGTVVTGTSIASITSTGATVWLTRTSTTATNVFWIVFGS